MIACRCDQCGKQLKVKDELAGKKVKCTGCGKPVAVPQTNPTLAGQSKPPITFGRSLLAAEKSGDTGADSVAGNGGEQTLDAWKAKALSSEEPKELWDFLAPAEKPDEIGRLGPYRVLKVLGAGGMGVVFKAEDPHLERVVALKAMLPGLASTPSAKQRFFREAKAAAALKHPNIVTIHQVGEDRGAPFLAMEFLEGEPLDARLKRAPRLPVPEILRIGRQVAEGLAAAHSRGLIHRDIKPANIWLETSGACSSLATHHSPLAPQVKILDFGLARAMADDTHLTQSGAIIGTPAYMAPEQAEGLPVDQRSDLFSLGCVLYRMSSGEMPFKGASTLAILSSLANKDPLPPLSLNAELPAELSDLVMRLLAKKPEERPESAHAVVEALAALESKLTSEHLPRPGNEPSTRIKEGPGQKTVIAAPVKRKSRRSLLLPAAAAALGLLVTVIVLGKAFFGGAVPSNDNDPVLGKLPAPLDQLDREKIPAYELETARRAAGVKQPLKELVAIFGDSRLKHWAEVYSVAFSPDGKTLASASLDGTMKLWDPATGNELGTLKGHTHAVLSVAFSPDGKTLASASHDGTVKLWDPAAGSELRTLKGHTNGVTSVAFSPDGKTLASASHDGTVKLWNSAAGSELRTLKGHTNSVHSVAFSPDGKTLASGSHDGAVKLWDPAAGSELRTLKGHTGGVYSVAFSPDGKTLASGSYDGVKLWDPATGAELRTLKGHTNIVSSVAFSPDGKTLASGSNDNTVKLWDPAAGNEFRTLKGHTNIVYSVAFSPDGKTLASGSLDQTVKLWDPAAGGELRTLKGHTHAVLSVAFSPDGKTLASGSHDGTVKLWDPATGGELRTLKGHNGYVYSVAFSPDGKTLASGSWDQTVKLWDPATGAELRTLKGHTNQVYSVAFSPDGKTLASGSWDQTVKLWDPATGAELRTLKGHTNQVYSVAFSPDGKTLASGSHDFTVKLWDPATGAELRTLKGHTNQVYSVAFSPDGKTLASGSHDGTVKLWDRATGNEFRTLKGHTSAVSSVAFSPDGKTLASAAWDGTVRLWDPGSASEKVFRLGPTFGQVRQVAFAADGRHLATANGNGTVYILRLDPKDLAPP